MPIILLVEDHQRVAQAITRFLWERGHSEVIAVARSGEEALEMLSRLKVELVLVDVSLPDINGIELVAAIRIRHPELLCVMLSGHLASNYVARALKVGARGYILKGDARAILEGIEKVMNGEIYLSAEVRDPE
jgi:two-component system response regulator NreC